LEQQVVADYERIETKYSDVTPIGKNVTSEDKPVNYVDEEEEHEDEEEEDNDDEESESPEDEDDEELELEIEEQDSPAF